METRTNGDDSFDSGAFQKRRRKTDRKIKDSGGFMGLTGISFVAKKMRGYFLPYPEETPL